MRRLAGAGSDKKVHDATLDTSLSPATSWYFYPWPLTLSTSGKLVGFFFKERKFFFFSPVENKRLFFLLFFFIPGQSSRASQHDLNFWILTVSWKRRTKWWLRRCLSAICFPYFRLEDKHLEKSRNKGTTKAKMLWSAGTAWLNRRRAHGQGKHSAGKTLPDYTSRTVLADQTPPTDCLFRGLIRWTGVSGCLQRHVALFVRHSTDVSRPGGLDASLSNTLWLTLASANWQVSAAAPSFFMRVFHAGLKSWFCWPWY